jgi:protein-disulfide isomerase
MMADVKDSITISKDILYGIVIIGLAAILALSIFTQGFGIVKPATQYAPVQPTQPTAPTQPSAPSQPSAPAQPTAPGQLAVAAGNLPALGQASASVSIVEFSDFQCPFCGKLYSDALAQIKTNYVNSGKVKLYYRDFPLSFHPNADPAANAARCANEQGKFWSMHDKIFDTQSSWSGLSDAGSAFKGDVAELGLNADQFNSCYDSKKYESDIQADETQGQSYGVQGTPGSYIIIPKTKISADTIKSAVSSTQGLELFENPNEYIVFVAGAYPYSAFDAVLSKVSY